MLKIERDQYYSEKCSRITAHVLKTVGIFPDKIGYDYMVHLIDLLIEQGKTDLARLYHVVADIYGTSAKSVEASITYLVNAMSRVGIDLMLRTLGLSSLAEMRCRLTTKKTIYLLYDFVREENKKLVEKVVFTANKNQTKNTPFGEKAYLLEVGDS